MNEEVKVQEVNETLETDVKVLEETTPEQKQQIQLGDLKIGYVVGLTQDNNFVFDVFGQSQGLVELLGIHSHAEKQVNAVYNNSQVTGDRLVHEVGKAVQVIGQKLDQLVGIIAPSKPDNEIG